MRIVFLCWFALVSLPVVAQIDSSITHGNRSFESKAYEEALQFYHAAYNEATSTGNVDKSIEAMLLIGKANTHLYRMDDALKAYALADSIATVSGNTLEMSRCKNALAVILTFQGHHNQAVELSREVIQMQAGDTTFVSDAYSVIGDYYGRVGNLDSCIYYLQEAISLDSLSNNHRSIPFNYTRLGETLAGMGHNELALKKYLAGLEWLDRENDSFKMATFYERIGSLFLTMYNLPKSREYAERAIRIARDHELTTALAQAESLMGRVLMAQGQADSAYSHLANAHELFQSINRKFNLGMAKDGLAEWHLKKGQIDEAEVWNTSADTLFQSLELQKTPMNHLLVQAKLFYAQGKWTAFEEKLSMIRRDSSLNNSPYDRRRYLDLAYQHSKVRKRYDEALLYLEQARELDDSLFRAESAYIIEELEARYDRAQKEREIAELDTKNELQSIKLNQRNTQLLWSLIGGGVMLVLLLFILLQYRTIKQRNIRVQEQNQIISRNLAEKELLLREIHHRVKNNLQIVSSLLSIQSREITDKKALEAVNESRNRVKSMALIHQDLYRDDNLIGINAKSYIDKLTRSVFSSYRIDEHRINLKTQIDQLTLDVDTSIPIGLIINELITNSIKYAFPGERTGEISIRLQEEQNALVLEVADDGVGISPAATDREGESFGIKMIKAFASKLDAQWQVQNANGTRVTLQIHKYKPAVSV
ncbi:MAG: ATP-binding protein [Flavobacteriales bacterium]|nr:ATP-binding protein [Flavobacteriales bacterium]